MLKFATDGAVINKTRNGVQGTMKLIPATVDGHAATIENFPKHVGKEITLYYFIGKDAKNLNYTVINFTGYISVF